MTLTVDPNPASVPPARALMESPSWGIFLFLSSGILVPFFIVQLTPESSGLWPWFMAVSIFSSFRYSMLVNRGRPALYELTTWLFIYLFLGLAPMVQIRTNSYPETTPGMFTELEDRSAAIIILGIVSLSFGMWSYKGAPGPSGRHILNTQRIKRIAFASLIASWWYLQKIGPTIFESRDQYSMLRNTLWPNPVIAVLIGAATTIPLLVATAATLVVARREGYKGLRLLLIAEIVTLLILNNPISSARISFGTVLLSVLAILGGFSQPYRFRMSAIAILAGLVLVFPYADAFRHGFPTGSEGKGGPIQAMTRGDFDSFAQITNSVNYVDRHGVSNGRQALGVALFWVPRSIWPQKPEDTGILLGKDRQYQFTNLSAPLWSELYVNGKWVALILGMATLGWALRRQDSINVNSPQDGILANILPFYMLIVYRGSLLQAMAGVVSMIAASAFVARTEERQFEGCSNRSANLS